MSVPNTFASATTSIPLANLDANFAYYDAAFSISGTATSFVGNITLTSGTANGVAYLNGSKVLTTGTALTFDGTNLGVGGVPQYVAANRSSLNVNGTNTAIIGVSSGGSTTTAAYLYWDGSLGHLASTASMAFEVSSAEQMRLTSTGLGIGTSSPSAKLEVYTGASSSVDYTGLRMTNGGENGTNLDFYNAFGPLAQIKGTKLGGGGDANEGVITFSTSIDAVLSERMRLDSSGNLLVGTTSSSGTGAGTVITAGGASLFTRNNTNYVQYVSNLTNSGSAGFVTFEYGTSQTQIGSISTASGTVTLYNTTSDQRLKKNIQDAETASALIDSLQVRQYDWKSDGSHQRYGFVAQELVTVAPEAVHQPADPEEMMAVDYSKLVPMLVKEIQNLRKRLAALEAK
jgi:hypothetical protein